MRHANGVGRVDDIYDTSADLAKADATWSFVPGLAGTGGGGCVSIESRNYRGSFLRHQNGEVVLQPFQDTAQYRQDATFCRVPGLADGAATSFRAFQFPNAYLRHALGVLRLDDDHGEAQFRQDATFELRGPWLTGKFFNPILGAGADPTMAYENSSYYLVSSDNDRGVVIRQASSIEQLEDAAPKSLWRAPACPAPACAGIWAPELQKIDGRWWIYVAGENGGGNASHRMFALRGSSDPMGPYENLGEVRLPGDEWAIDGAYVSHGGQGYFLWSGWENGDPNVQHIFLSRMSSPNAATGGRVKIASPTAPWETVPNGSPNIRVNEGPQPIHGPNGRLSVTISVNGSWTNDYCVGLLTLNGSDPMVPGGWSKSSSCVFSGRDTATAPGHNGFFTVNGRPWLAYHALIQPGSGWGGRSIRAQPMAFNGDGIPSLGVPVSIHEPVALP
ncbi:family 43 glycosylhydrolase [Pendulispora rubella]|uniref:Family 43 glycosylhydrolase n=1 Tax=Pendulispora rubella TaxID=2741070 RepID=A0ABZ2L264_9BACT